MCGTRRLFEGEVPGFTRILRGVRTPTSCGPQSWGWAWHPHRGHREEWPAGRGEQGPREISVLSVEDTPFLGGQHCSFPKEILQGTPIYGQSTSSKGGCLYKSNARDNDNFPNSDQVPRVCYGLGPEDPRSYVSAPPPCRVPTDLAAWKTRLREAPETCPASGGFLPPGRVWGKAEVC